MTLFKTEAEFDAAFDELRKLHDRIPKQARGPAQNEAVLSEPEEQAAARLIESGTYRRVS